MREHAALGASEVVKALGTAVAEWSAGEPQDDETLLVVSRLPLSGEETPAVGRERRDPLAQLAEARAAGAPLVLHASLESLATLGPWLERAPDLAELDADLRSRVELALYEVCANIAEHGLGFDESRQFDLWWVSAVGKRGTDVDARVRAGYFLLRDDGYPFSPGRWQPGDLGDPASIVLSWVGCPSDTRHVLTIAADRRTMTLDQPVCQGDTLGVDRVLVLTFDGAVPAGDVEVSIQHTGS